jgi:hypothetical protein
VTGNRYVIYRIDGEGLTEGKARDNEWELASADMVRGESVPTIWLKKKTKVTPKIKVRYKKAEVTKKTEVTQKASGRSFSAEEVKAFSKRNRKKRLSAAK